MRVRVKPGQLWAMRGTPRVDMVTRVVGSQAWWYVMADRRGPVGRRFVSNSVVISSDSMHSGTLYMLSDVPEETK